MREKKKGVYQKYLKNLLDRLLALVGTAALSWLLLGVGIAVRLDSPGPVLFRQKRVGRNGQYFYIYKFRTMRIDTPLVGPRPALWNQEDLISERERYGANSVRPGLTGWAQIHGRDELPIREKAELDGYYVHHIALGMDLECLCKTAGAVLRQDGIHEGMMENRWQ